MLLSENAVYNCVLDNPNCVWKSVECRLSNMEGILQELREDADDCTVDYGAFYPGPINLGAHFSDPCAVHGTHPIRKCGDRKRRG